MADFATPHGTIRRSNTDASVSSAYPDTALLAAGWRAMESSRSDALFDDPLAAGLAGESGLRIAATLPDGAWVVAIRTVVIDGFVRSAIASPVDTIINIGAGLDTRPYRMELPSSL